MYTHMYLHVLTYIICMGIYKYMYIYVCYTHIYVRVCVYVQIYE